MISLADEYREFARECVAWARTSRSQQQRKQLLELARSWTAAATNLERALEGHRTIDLNDCAQASGASRLPIID